MLGRPLHPPGVWCWTPPAAAATQQCPRLPGGLWRVPSAWAQPLAHTTAHRPAPVPVYSSGFVRFPSRKNMSVGYSVTANSLVSSGSEGPSTLASLVLADSAASRAAALMYSGASALQCPHHGASGGQGHECPWPPWPWSQPLLPPGQSWQTWGQSAPAWSVSLCTSLLTQPH